MKLSAIDAYKIVRTLPHRNYLVLAMSTEKVWAFHFSDHPLSPGDSTVGGCFDAIDKTTGEMHQIVIPYELDELDGGVHLDVKKFRNIP